MFIGTLSPISNRADWIDTLQLLDEEDPSQAISITDATAINLEVRAPGSRSIVLTASLGSGITHIETGVIQWAFTADQMASLYPGDYEVGCTITKDGVKVQLLIGVVPILDGVMS